MSESNLLMDSIHKKNATEKQMKKIPITLIALMILPLLGCGPGNEAQAAGKGMVKIVTSPGDARLFIDGKRKGNSPAEAGQTFAIKLPEGEYLIEAVKETGGKDEYYGKKKIFVAEDTLQTVSLKLAKRPSAAFRKHIQQILDSGAYVPEMVKIPGGSFRMGCLSGGKECFNDEKPAHRVTLSPFYMGKYEVTFDQWDACVADGGCSHDPDDEGWGRGKRPVINVSWNDVQEYIRWLNQKTGQHYRLPTEAEWEYAARAGTTTRYSWGDEIGKNNANCDGCGSQWDNKKTAPVGSFAPNPWGLYDMHGNVWEWVQDWYDENYYRHNPAKDPKGPATGRNRVNRGGSWLSVAGVLRSAGRSLNSPGHRYDGLGFRLVRQP